MKCICKLKVDKLRRNLTIAQRTVLGIQVPELSALENLGVSEDLSEDFTAPALVESTSLSEDFELSESESATINAAEQLTETANLQKSLDEGFGIDPSLPTAPGKLGGIIHAAKVSGLIDVLQTIADFEGLNPIAAAANAIDSAVRKFGHDLMESKLADDTGSFFNKHANSIKFRKDRPGGLFNSGKGGGNNTSDGKGEKDEPPEIPSKEDLEKKRPDEWPDMIGDSVRKLNDYVAKTPKSQIQRTSLADLMIDSLGSSLSNDLSKLDLNDLIARAKLKAERKYASHLINESNPEGKASSPNAPKPTSAQSQPGSSVASDEYETNENDGTNDENSAASPKKAETSDKSHIVDNEDDSKFEITVKALDQSNGEKMISFPDLPKVANKMANYDLRGRSSWDQKKSASKALKEIDELERLKEEKIKEFKEARELREAKEEAESLFKSEESKQTSIEEQFEGEAEPKVNVQVKTPELPKVKDSEVDVPVGTPEIPNSENAKIAAELANSDEQKLINQITNDGSTPSNKSSDSGAQVSKNVAKAASSISKSETTPKAPTTEEELSLKLAKESGTAAKEAMVSSALTANSAVEVMNQTSSMTQSLIMNPTTSNPETLDRLKNLSSTSTNSSIKASEASTNALKNFKLTMKHLTAGDLEKAVETRDLAVKDAEEAKIAQLNVQKARQDSAKLKEAINSNNDDSTVESEPEKGNNEEAKKRFIKGKVDQAVSSAMKDMGGNILSPSGLSSIAEKVTSIQINIPAITVVNASLSTEMLLKATAKLALFLSLKSTFGDNLLGPSGGASIQASINSAISAAASIGGSAGASAGLGGGAGAGGSLGGGLGASAGGGVGGGVGVGASLSATAAISALGDLFSGSSPSVMAILLLKGILLQLKMLGNDVVETNACYLSLYSMAGKDAKKYYEERLEKLEEELAQINAAKGADTSTIDNLLPESSQSANDSQEDGNGAVEKNSDNGEGSNKDGSAESDGEKDGNSADDDGNSDQSDDDQESKDQTLSAANSNFANIASTASWFQTSKRLPLKLNLSDKQNTEDSTDLLANAGSEKDFTTDNSKLQGLSNLTSDGSDSSDSDSLNLTYSNSSDFGSDSDDLDSLNLSAAGSDSEDKDNASWFQNARRAPLQSELNNDANAGDSGNAGDSNNSNDSGANSDSEDTNDSNNQNGSDSEDSKRDSAKSSDDGSNDSGNLHGDSSSKYSSKSSAGGKVAAGVAAGAIGAVGIGAMAAMAMRNKGGRSGVGDSDLIDGGNSGGDGNEDTGFDGSAGNDDSGNGNMGGSDSANSPGNSHSGTGSVISGGSRESDDDGPWHQRAKHNDPSKKVSKNIYAVGDPTVKAKQDEDENGAETDPSDFEEIKKGNKWHHRAKHDNTTELRPEREDNPSPEDPDSEVK